jgi:PIN domain nuclease of toxin-antitoxin system
MRLLLDTHILLWALSDAQRLGRRGRELIDDSDAYVSAASIWEISIKVALGKLQAAPDKVNAALTPAGFKSLPVTLAHAAALLRLEPKHRDPFDRMLVTQARAEGMTLLTNDEALATYGDEVLVLTPRK